MIKLSELDPVAVAREVCGWVTEHVESMASNVGVSEIRWPEPLESSELGRCVDELTRYAKEGHPFCGGSDGPADYIQTVAEALFAASHPRVYSFGSPAWPWGQRNGEPSYAIEVVLLAALARDEIIRGNEVHARGLAVLAEIEQEKLDELHRRGELKVTGFHVAPAEARRWLSGRGVLLTLKLESSPRRGGELCSADIAAGVRCVE